MRLPARHTEIDLERERHYESLYPPLGFVPFSNHSLGNGDHFGLYWPIGREDKEPIVVEALHDECSLRVVSRTLDDFLAMTANIDQDDYAALSEVNDIDLLESASYWERKFFGSCRVKEFENAYEQALCSIICPPSFDLPSQKALHWLRRQDSCPENLRQDPIWLNRHRLTLRFGGMKTNDDYGVFKDAIHSYAERCPWKAVVLLQTYGELMNWETQSFQERYKFELSSYIKMQTEMSLDLGFDRVTLQN